MTWLQRRQAVHAPIYHTPLKLLSMGFNGEAIKCTCNYKNPYQYSLARENPYQYSLARENQYHIYGMLFGT